MKKNLSLLNCKNNIEVFNETVFNFIDNLNKNKSKYDIIFIDPPYKESKIEELLSQLSKKRILSGSSLIILHRNKKTKDKFPTDFNILFERTYGLSKIYFGKFSL